MTRQKRNVNKEIQYNTNRPYRDPTSRADRGITSKKCCFLLNCFDRQRLFYNMSPLFSTNFTQTVMALTRQTPFQGRAYKLLQGLSKEILKLFQFISQFQTLIQPEDGFKIIQSKKIDTLRLQLQTFYFFFALDCIKGRCRKTDRRGYNKFVWVSHRFVGTFYPNITLDQKYPDLNGRLQGDRQGRQISFIKKP